MDDNDAIRAASTDENTSDEEGDMLEETAEAALLRTPFAFRDKGDKGDDKGHDDGMDVRVVNQREKGPDEVEVQLAMAASGVKRQTFLFSATLLPMFQQVGCRLDEPPQPGCADTHADYEGRLPALLPCMLILHRRSAASRGRSRSKPWTGRCVAWSSRAGCAKASSSLILALA